MIAAICAALTGCHKGGDSSVDGTTAVIAVGAALGGVDGPLVSDLYDIPTDQAEILFRWRSQAER